MGVNTKIVENFFDSKYGFGKHKPIARDLLQKTISILNEFDINYFLISGTLLGYVRHNDFIPWDDDIDLIVDSSFLSKISAIKTKYTSDNLQFTQTYANIFKSHFKNGIRTINKKGITYSWPFIDLFIYETEDNKLLFFRKEWNIESFFPAKKVLFLGMDVNIPHNPEYFLTINYGNDYMTILNSGTYNHQIERSKKSETITMKQYQQVLQRKQAIKTSKGVTRSRT